MASIYAKALVRRDYSGIVDKKDEKKEEGDKDKDKARSRTPSAASNSESHSLLNGKSSKKKKSKKEEAKDDPKNTSGADVGKIANLMSGDANRVAMIVSGAYFIYVRLVLPSM
jgi:hypothetical protein